jgi:hypothetical protein
LPRCWPARGLDGQYSKDAPPNTLAGPQTGNADQVVIIRTDIAPDVLHSDIDRDNNYRQGWGSIGYKPRCDLERALRTA